MGIVWALTDAWRSARVGGHGRHDTSITGWRPLAVFLRADALARRPEFPSSGILLRVCLLLCLEFFQTYSAAYSVLAVSSEEPAADGTGLDVVVGFVVSLGSGLAPGVVSSVLYSAGSAHDGLIGQLACSILK